jgi:diguanylate cyclase (GGDEF)-like protein
VPASIFSLDDTERARMLDFARRLRAVRWQALVFLIPVVVLGMFAYGPLIAPPIVGLVAGFAALAWIQQRIRRIEFALVGFLVVAQAAIITAIALASRYQLDALGLLILPAAAACIMLPRAWMVVFTAWSVAITVGAAFAIDAHRVAEVPPILILPIGVMLCVVLPAAMIRKLEIDSRDTAMIDALTGALNRMALEARIAELTAQAHALPLRVGVIMGDLDHFKRVNDELGHEAGDVVLKRTVQRMRGILGPLTPVYRAGGEEFCILMAGAEESEVRSVAEQLREAVRDDSMGDRPVTMSFGIAAGTLDVSTVASVIEVADQALYRAKRTGRDRVASANPNPMSVLAAEQSSAPSGAVGVDAPVDDRLTGHVVVAPATVALGHDNGNWFVRGDFERDHIRESAHALSRTHHGALGFVFIALAASIPWMGWHLMLPAIPAVIAYHAAERRILKITHPEYVLMATWISVQLAIFFGALIADPAEPYMLVLFSPMMIGMTAVYPTRGVLVNSASTVGAVILGGLWARPDLLGSYPGLMGPPVLLVIGIALMSSVTGRSAIEHRTKAVVDPLTGLLTRAALQSRLAEISGETQVDGARVSVIAFDVDEFKGLNDTHGHALGDAVLRAVGAATRSHLHALEWAFRLGGDEFVVVVPAAQSAATQLAERLRVALAEVAVEGVHITGSFGVAATSPGERFDFEAVSRRADSALYEAKRGGRNRVAVAAPVAPGPAPVATVLRGAA